MTNALTRFPLPPSPIPANSLTSTRGSDRQLVDRFVARNGHAAELAFGELVRRHGPLVFGVCRNILQNPQDAEDAFQATFVILARKASSLQRPDRLSFWLHGVATRVAKKAKSQIIRRTRRELQVPTMNEVEPIGDWGRHDLQLSEREEIATLHEEIARLPEKYRLPVLLCDLEGLTHVAASRYLQWPSGSLSVRLMRARKLLHDRLTQRGLAPSSLILAASAQVELASSAVRPALAEQTARAVLRDLDLRRPGSTLGMGGGSASVGSFTGRLLSAVAQTKLILVLSMAMSLGVIAIALRPSDHGEHSAGRPPLQTAGTQPGESTRNQPAPPAGATIGADTDRQKNKISVNISNTLIDITREATSPVAPHKVLPGEALVNYAVLVKQTNRDARSQVRLALWCEANGLVAERLKHLVQAVLTDPDQPAARGLLGQISFRGRWRRPEDLGPLLAEDTRLTVARAAYEDRRAGTSQTADAQWSLALWCEQNGLSLEARAHLTAVTRLDPTREAAWRRLGYQKSRGRWMSPARIASETSLLKARKSADQSWKPRLAKWKSALQEDAKRPGAEAELLQITDPFAARSVWATFAGEGSDGQILTARLLGQLEGSEASRGLAVLAVFGESPEVRRIATEVLARRDPRDVVSLLIHLLIDPVKYETRPVQWQGTPGILFVEGEQFNLRRLYTAPPLPENTIRRLLDPTTPPDFTLPIAAVLGEDAARLASLPSSSQVFRNNVRFVRNSVRHSVCCGGGRSEQRQAGNPGNSPSERFTRPCGAGGGPAAPVGTSFRLCWGRDRELTLPTCLSHKRNQPPGQRMLASQASGERELPVFLKRGSLADTAAPQRRAGRSR
ncbi:RNA polymerase sigma factor, sigma-70 family [Singulisphaera sp. GP187]|uniref:sigma-70 family RNA polymerase sigma factor n=1 Tax=Singulisphaera sp. GP187 TaxID=1882752 RepID=UPI000928B85E|nr:sigma-70 family RNA polymerase sigma factor [Singulisphaera sp. GP187]SIO56119.1 RNA polymerase sigma factor, sigma-70 family [Singulisphaera sp. GP187]